VRLVGGALLCLAAAAALYVASALVHVPRLVAYRWVEPGATALMALRAERDAGPQRAGGWSPLSKIAPSLLNAALHAEDDGFASHLGFDVARMRLAVRSDVEERRFARGASTISQQLVKNLFLNPARNPLRKLKEAILTLALEAALPKPRILELYLNVIEWGPGVYGVAAASETYFERPPARLSPSQAALLAASISSPLRRNPKRLTPGLRWKQRLLLSRMRRRNLVPPEWTG
jgi:monofunctional biosynthetic peptidoglycan transglycosylase